MGCSRECWLHTFYSLCMLIFICFVLFGLTILPLDTKSFWNQAEDVLQFIPLMGVVFIWERIFARFAKSIQARSRLRKCFMIFNYYLPMYYIFGRVLFTYTASYWAKGLMPTNRGYHYTFREADWNETLGYLEFRLPWDSCGVHHLVAARTFNESYAVGMDDAWRYVENASSHLEGKLKHTCERYCTGIGDAYNDTALKKACEDTLRKTGFDNWLKYLVIAPPFCVWASLAVSVYLTGTHILELIRGEYDEMCWHRHDKVILILALPAVYGILAFKASTRCLGVVYSLSEIDEEEQWKYYNADFAVSDLYEALALLWFGNLTFTRIKEDHQAVQDEIQGKLERESSSLKRLLNKGKEIYQPMASSTESLLDLCVGGFILSCFLDAAIDMIDLIVWEYEQDYYQSISSVMQKAQNFMMGFGFVTSSFAIYGIIKIEVAFHSALHGFRAWWKFLSCKLLVSLAFCQQIVCFVPLPGLGKRGGVRVMTVKENNFFYAACLAIESLLVSWVCLKAWASDESWYRDGGQGNHPEPPRSESEILRQSSPLREARSMYSWMEGWMDGLNLSQREIPDSKQEPFIGTLSTTSSQSDGSKTKSMVRETYTIRGIACGHEPTSSVEVQPVDSADDP